MTKPFPNLSLFPFRPDVQIDQVKGFNRDQQIAFCTHQLESIRQHHPHVWATLAMPKPPRSSGLAEIKNMAKLYIRRASESNDFYTTVDFITQTVYGLLDNQRGSREKGLLKHLKDWGTLSHEHMVPGEFIFRQFVLPTSRFHRAALLDPMAKWSLRALVARTKCNGMAPVASSELQALRGPLESDMPCPATVYGVPKLALEDIPLEFYGLIRYEAARLADELIPVSSRAQALLPRYLKFRAQLFQRGRAKTPKNRSSQR